MAVPCAPENSKKLKLLFRGPVKIHLGEAAHLLTAQRRYASGRPLSLHEKNTWRIHVGIPGK